MSKLDTFRKKLVIDEHALEIALREHPQLVYDVGIELALAISNRDEAKQTLEELEAETAISLRREAELAEERVTDKSIESQVKFNRGVKEANAFFLEKKLEAAQWSVLKDSFDQRSYALSKLVDLYLANYYSNIEKTGAGDYKTAQAAKVKKELSARRNREQS